MVLAATAAAAATLATPVAHAETSTSTESSTHPVFRLPFPCGEGWNGATYYNHAGPGNDYALDLNQGEDNEDLGHGVIASEGGTVNRWIEADNDHIVEIDHGGGWSTEYRHLNDFVVADGATVSQGQLIGHLGRNGTQLAHLHYEQQLDDTAAPVSFDGVPISYSYSYNGPLYISHNCPGMHTGYPSYGTGSFRMFTTAGSALAHDKAWGR